LFRLHLTLLVPLFSDPASALSKLSVSLFGTGYLLAVEPGVAHNIRKGDSEFGLCRDHSADQVLKFSRQLIRAQFLFPGGPEGIKVLLIDELVPIVLGRGLPERSRANV
jgi:hypothetical protein